MKFKYVRFEQEGRVAVLTINRPEKRNVLNKATRFEISSVIDKVKQDPGIGVLVVTGAEQLDIPVIAMINGLCLGAGCEIALACDLRIAADTARFGQPEILLGIMPGSGATQRLTRLVGPGKAKELIFTGDTIDAAEALAIGLVNRVVPVPELKKTVMELGHKIASRGAFSLKMAKRAIQMGQEVGLTPGLAFEALADMACFCSPEKEEGVDAFFAKRNPQFHKKP
jgi:enoyl-CoA hydratase